MRRRLRIGCCVGMALASLVWAQQPPAQLPHPDAGRPGPAPAAGEDEKISPRLKFSNATLDIVLADYAEKTGRTLLQGPGLPNATITLRSQGTLTMEEYLQAIESVLAMYGVALLRVEDEFLKVVPNTKALQEGMKITAPAEAGEGGDTDRLVIQMIPLKHIDIAEAQKAIESLKHAYGQIQLYERINSILVMDTQANVNRFLQIIGYIDQPVEAREEPNIVVILHAKASEIKSKLEEIIADQQKDQKRSTVPRAKTTGQPGVERPNVPGVIRARPSTQGSPEQIAEMIEMAERGVIRGKVKIVADDRTNILIIITRPENMSFFEKIIAVLDVETDPDVTVKIIRLEYAEAKTVEATLNNLIGRKSKSGEAKSGAAPKGDSEAGRSEALREFVSRSGEGGEATPEGKSKVGELSSENIKILADERTNALLIMASKSDLTTLEEIVRNMDIMLSQVMVESVIVQVSLDDTVSSGVQWVQRSMIAYEGRADGGRRARAAYAGTIGGGSDSIRDATTLNAISSAGAGLTAYFTHFGMNMDAIVTMLQSDSRTQIMSAPVIVTTDNTEAVLTSSEQKYFLKGSTVDQFGNVRPETEIKDIGLELTVTPHINEQGNVMMEIAQEVSDEGAPQEIADLGTFPTTVTRSFKASITVQGGETIVLGGLVRNSATRSKAGVPLLSRIPLLGWFFRSGSNSDERSEVVVFVTPYVLDTPQQIAEESRRRKDALNIEGVWTRGWSGSRLADDPEGRWTARGWKDEGGEAPASEDEDAEDEDAEDEDAEDEDAEEDEAQEPGAEPVSDLDPAMKEFMRRQEGRLEATAVAVEEVE